jgi:hypothetical protein
MRLPAALSLSWSVAFAALVTAISPAVAPAFAQSVLQAGSAHRVAVPSAHAVRRDGPIVLDAKLDEAAWAQAKPITEFKQVDPDEGKPASQRTEVRFLYDDDALYVGAKMYDTGGAAGVTTRLVRRDATFDSDYLELVIDGYHDHLGRAFFDLNPSGSKGDYIGMGLSCCDNSWDPVWEAATHIDTDGWTAEIRIPYSQLHFSRDSVQTWGLEVRRFIKRRNEQDQWAFWYKNEAGGPSRFGHLDGIRIPHATSGLELLPYAVTKSSSLASATPGDPFNTHGRPSMRAGLDLKDRVTSNLTLDATFNPDFGQVEVDPAVLNLSAFETFFQEKRPFFIEGAQVFDFGGFSCNFCSNVESMGAFYSRRIGRTPTGADLATDNYAFSRVPDATTILGAGKLTGRTANGTTIGVLNAVTGQANADVATLSGDRLKQEVEPLANYFVGRVKQDFLNGNLVIGGMLSGVARNIDTTFAPRLAKHAELYGNDLFYTWHDHMFTLRAQGAITNVSGDPQEILLRQESSARYFQRPDRGAVSGFLSTRYDSNATSMQGAGWYARLGKDIGNWFGEVQTNSRTPGYETNDYAFQQRADYMWYGTNVGRNWTKPGLWYRSISALVGAQAQNNFEGDRTSEQLHTYFSTTTPRFWNVSAMYIDRPSVIDDRQLRGGPAVRTPTAHYTELDVSSDSRSALIGNGSLDYYWDQAGGVNPALSLSATYRPAPNLSVSFGPSISKQRAYAQYVQAVADSTATKFFGSRYVMSNLDQRTLELDTRLSVTFSPTMTLELFVQPFFAAGRYYDFKEYTAPRQLSTVVYGKDVGSINAVRDTTGAITSYAIDPDGAGPAKSFTISNPNFSQQSLRGNAVFRWEYRPGSVIYVAWTQSRAADAAFGDLRFDRDRDALLAAKPDNIFLVKASWWVGR